MAAIGPLYPFTRMGANVYTNDRGSLYGPSDSPASGPACVCFPQTINSRALRYRRLHSWDARIIHILVALQSRRFFQLGSPAYCCRGDFVAPILGRWRLGKSGSDESPSHGGERTLLNGAQGSLGRSRVDLANL